MLGNFFPALLQRENYTVHIWSCCCCCCCCCCSCCCCCCCCCCFCCCCCCCWSAFYMRLSGLWHEIQKKQMQCLFFFKRARKLFFINRFLAVLLHNVGTCNAFVIKRSIILRSGWKVLLVNGRRYLIKKNSSYFVNNIPSSMLTSYCTKFILSLVQLYNLRFIGARLLYKKYVL
jgi:hypothetical protein